MGRFSIYNRIKPDSRSKKERIRREEEAMRERAKTYTTQQIALKGLLQGYAIDVLEAAAKGH